MKNSRRLIVLLTLLALSACSNLAVKKPADNSKTQTPAVLSLSNDQQKLYFQAKLLAERAISQRRYDVASSNFLVAAELAQSAVLAKKAVMAAENSVDPLTSYQAATLWVKLKPKSQIAYAWKAIGELRSHQSRNLQKTLTALYHISGKSNDNSYIGITAQIIERVPSEWTLKNFISFADKHAEDPQVWLVLGKLSERMSNVDSALAYVNKALDLAPDNAFALEEKGLIYQRSGQNKQALDYFSKMEKKFPDIYALKLHLAQIYYQKGQNKPAQDLLGKYLKAKPDIAFARYLLAASYLADEQIDKSERQFLYLLNQGYKPGMVNYFLGEIYQEKNELKLAVQFFDAVKKGKYLIRARISGARILFNQKNYTAAFSQLRNAPSTNLAEQMYLATTEINMLRSAKLLEKNIVNIWDSFKSKPTNIYLFTRALLTAKSKKDRANMIQLALNSTKSFDVTKALIETATEISNRVGDSEQAIKLLNEFLESVPDEMKLRYNRAMIFAAKGKMKKMEADLRYILRLDPNHIDALNALGYSLADENRDLDTAYKMILEAYRNRPGSAAITDSLGWVLYRKGQLKEASEQLEQAWNLSPTADIGAHLGEVLWQSGDKDKAKSFWQKSIKIDATNNILIETLKRFKQ